MTLNAQMPCDTPITTQVVPENAFICMGDSVDLTAEAMGGDSSVYMYDWSNGDSTQTIRVGDPGTYTVTVTDTCVNSSTADAVVEMYSGGQISCENDQNVSVDENCEALITPDMMLTGTYSCQDQFSIEIEDQSGNPVSNPVTSDYVGQTLNVHVFNQDQSNQCWGEVTIEDKMGPTITCRDTSVVCYQLDSLDKEDIVQASDNCSDDIEIILTDETIDFLNCDSDTVKRITREYVAQDGNGAISQPCSVDIYVTLFDESEITGPEDTTVYCGPDLPLKMNGAPVSDSTGYPTVAGMNIENPYLQNHCLYDVDVMDNFVFDTDCEKIINRIWTIQGVCISAIREQQITLVDTTGPQVTCPDLPDTLSTNMFQCTGTFFIPAATATDFCNDVKHIDLSVDSEWNTPPVEFMQDFDGGFIQLPAGPNTLTYTAYDDCHRSSSCSIEVYVEDQNPPVPVCDQHTVVSLNQDGEAKVYAGTFDDGSLDDCMLDSFAVARMEGGQAPENDDFGPYIEFDCADQANNPNMVVFRVYDMAGNFNDCMVEVELQDKIGATIQCPPDVTVSCTYPLDLDNLDEFGTVHAISSLGDLTDPQTDPREDVIIDDPEGDAPQPHNWGQDGFAHDNCGINDMDISVTVDSMNQCGEAVITRTFTAMGPGGPVAECTQTISVLRTSPFTSNNIDWPLDVTVSGSCSDEDLDPEQLEATYGPEYGFPEVTEDQCDLVGIHYTDWQFNFIPGQQQQACYKLIRKWEIIDWCDFEDGEYEKYTHDQVIKVVDDQGPTFSSAARDTSVCSTAGCTMIPFSLTKNATDMCTDQSELFWEYNIDLNSGGSWSESDISGNTNTFSEEFEVGTHSVRWTVEDRCGNIETQTEHFTLSSCKAPSAHCQSTATSITQMVINGDTMNMAMLDVEMVDNGSSANCGGSVTLSFAPASNPSEAKDTLLFNCDDLGDNAVTLYVYDENWNSATCATMVDIQDPQSHCNSGSGSSTAVVGGEVETQTDQAMPDVAISFNGTGMDNVMTNTDGQYTFPAMSTGGENYEVIPAYDKNPLNGVSTYDLVLIQKHILGKDELIDPYKQIAADVNMSGEISAADMVELRQLILGIYDEFQQNESWRFVDKYYTFTTDNAASEDFPESYYIGQFTGDMMGVDFIGVKIGDINHSVSMDGFSNLEDRTGEELIFEFADRTYAAGDDIEVPVYAGSFDQLLGYQFSLDFDEESLLYTGLKAGALPVSEDHIGFPSGFEGLITMSWNDAEALQFKEGAPLFTLTFKAVADGAVHQAFQINSDVTRAEGYSAEGTVRPLSLGFRGSAIAGDAFELHQNIPNPFDQTTRIGFNLPKASDATLTIFDVTGKVIERIEGQYEQGYNEISLHKSELSAEGVMYYQLSTGQYTATKKMIMVE